MSNEEHRWLRRTARTGLLTLALLSFPAAFTGPPAARMAVIGALLVLGPGGGAALWMWETRGPGRDVLSAGFYLTVAIANSLAASLLVATLLVYTGRWSPAAGVCLLAAITAALVLASLTARYRPQGQLQ